MYAAHSFGDHWFGQTHRQALGKGARTRQGVRHCLGHVVLLAAHKAVALGLLCIVTGLHLSLTAAAIALAVDGASHYWADRRYTLAWLADRTGKGDFYRLGLGEAAPCGTGAYALDQSWHIAWLFVTALIIAVGAR
ncbi:transcriptional regulator [Nonomuraea sp. NPDC003560]|uniref:transcriptional regulator n=1 Tax=Nonomuraea sp. NPDC003560 TaxID=3364341 RepID=UPI0036ADB1A7